MNMKLIHYFLVSLLIQVLFIPQVSGRSSIPTSQSTTPRTTTPHIVTPQTTIPQTTTPQLGCYENGQYYPLGTEISRGEDRESNWCYGRYCDDTGTIVEWDTWDCFPTTVPLTTVPSIPTTPKTTTPKTTTPQLPGCYDNGQYYPPGTEISRGEDRESNWCYATICDEIGTIVHWDNFDCFPTTVPLTTVPSIPTTPKTTTPKTTTPQLPGCYGNGQYYPPGTEISRGEDRESNWCYATVCDESGTIVHWDNFHCFPTTVPLTTVPSIPTTPKTTTPKTTTPQLPGCYDNGQYYPPGTEISRGEDRESNWCYATVCDESGTIVHWDNFHCFPTTVPLTTVPSIPTTPKTTTPKTTTPQLPGCYDNGQYYPPGTEISRGEDMESNWCYGRYCDDTGTIVEWDTWDCFPTTVPLTTVPPTTTTPQLPGCYDNGQYYPPGTEISQGEDRESNWCYATVCDESGTIVYWDNFECFPTTVPLTTVPPITTTPKTTTKTTTPQLPGCYENGQYYPPGTEISRGEDRESNWCYGRFCDDTGTVVEWDTWDCFPTTVPLTTVPPITTTPKTTTKTTTPQLPGCYEDGQYYPPGTEISRGEDMESNWCYGRYCDDTGTIVEWDTWDCFPTTVPLTTVPPTTTTPQLPGCYDNGQYYPPGTEISQGEDRESNWCYATVCDESETIVYWDNFECFPTTVPLTTVPPITTTPKTTTKTTTPQLPGCYENGQYYPPGTEISRGEDRESNWCYGRFCDDTGTVVEWDTWDCFPTTVPLTTVPPITTTLKTTTKTTTPQLPGCYEDGQYYPPGTEISRGEDRESNWCYGRFCDDTGTIVEWDTWDCFPTTVPLTTVPSILTTPKTTTPKTTTPQLSGCYDNGQYYPPGTEISRGEDRESNWCYGTICDQSGTILHWDNFDCFPTTVPLTTVPPITTTPKTTTPKTTTPQLPGCYENGQYYPPGTEISRDEDRESNWCYATVCDESGTIVHWDNFDCFPTTVPLTTVPTITTTLKTTTPKTTTPQITTPQLGCYENGELYPPGTEISRGEDRESNWCYGTICDETGTIVYWDNFECFPTTVVLTTVPPTKVPLTTVPLTTVPPTTVPPTTNPPTTVPPTTNPPTTVPPTTVPPTTIPPTTVPPTTVPSTTVPPTTVPPTTVPPTTVPPTTVPPTTNPPTTVGPTTVPPTTVPPTTVPPTTVPPTTEPPTTIPPTTVPLTTVPPTTVPPTTVPPTTVPPTTVPLTTVPPTTVPPTVTTNPPTTVPPTTNPPTTVPPTTVPATTVPPTTNPPTTVPPTTVPPTTVSQATTTQTATTQTTVTQKPPSTTSTIKSPSTTQTKTPPSTTYTQTTTQSTTAPTTNVCSCNVANVADQSHTCDTNTGVCLCKPSWTGVSCDEDVNECAKNSSICSAIANQGCHNFVGGYLCDCIRGFTRANKECLLDVTTQPPESPDTSVAIELEVTLDISLPEGTDLSVHASYEEVKLKVKITLLQFFSEFTSVALRIIILDIRIGSIIPTFIIEPESDTNFDDNELKGDLAQATIALANGTTMIYDGKPVQAVATQFNSTDICGVYTKMFGQCDAGHACQIIEGQPSCVLEERKVRWAVIIGCIAGGVFIVMLAILCMCVRYYKRRRYDNRRSYKMDTFHSHSIMGSLSEGYHGPYYYGKHAEYTEQEHDAYSSGYFTWESRAGNVSTKAPSKNMSDLQFKIPQPRRF